MNVWMVQTGEYEDRHVVGLYISKDVAVASVKDRYKPPYKVTWREAQDCLIGTFENVSGYSIAHTAAYDITEEPVREG